MRRPCPPSSASLCPGPPLLLLLHSQAWHSPPSSPQTPRLAFANGTDSTVKENKSERGEPGRRDGSATGMRIVGGRLTENRKRRGRSATVSDKLVIRKLAFLFLFAREHPTRPRLERVNCVYSFGEPREGFHEAFSIKCYHHQ